MTSSTPSPSAQALADYVKGAIFVNARSMAVGFTMQRAVEIETALRRLSETERERDEAKERETILREDQRKLDAILDYLGIAASELDPVGFLRDLVAQADLATAERDQLREMLAQADAVIAHLENGVCTASEGGFCPYTREMEQAIERHRLSQKGK